MLWPQCCAANRGVRLLPKGRLARPVECALACMHPPVCDHTGSQVERSCQSVALGCCDDGNGWVGSVVVAVWTESVEYDVGSGAAREFQLELGVYIILLSNGEGESVLSSSPQFRRRRPSSTSSGTGRFNPTAVLWYPQSLDSISVANLIRREDRDRSWSSTWSAHLMLKKMQEQRLRQS